MEPTKNDEKHAGAASGLSTGFRNLCERYCLTFLCWWWFLVGWISCGIVYDIYFR